MQQQLDNKKLILKRNKRAGYDLDKMIQLNQSDHINRDLSYEAIDVDVQAILDPPSFHDQELRQEDTNDT